MIDDDFLKKHKCVKSINIMTDINTFSPIVKIIFNNDDVINFEINRVNFKSMEKIISNEINNYIMEERYNKINKIKKIIGK